MSSKDKTGRSDRPTGDPMAHPHDAGAYVGNHPEREAETIPGGIRVDDERIAAHSTQVKPVHDGTTDEPDRREAGQSR